MRRTVEMAEPVVYIGVIIGGAWLLEPISFFVVAMATVAAIWARLVWQTW